MPKPPRVRRTFTWKGQVLADPDPSMTPEQVLEYYAELYPELTNAVVTPLEETDGKASFSLEKPKAAATPKSSGGGSYKIETNQGKRG